MVAVSRDGAHRFTKVSVDTITLVPGFGVEGDAHAGATVQHLSRMRRDPSAPNLRQVHLIHAELIDELVAAGYRVAPGELGENVTTRGVDLLALPIGTRLRFGADAVVEVTGLRNPCVQLDRCQDGLMSAVLDRDASGALIRKAGVMSIVLAGGTVHPSDPIEVSLPAEPDGGGPGCHRRARTRRRSLALRG
ncbi:MAG: MOSC domain-containing protein [Actinomycetota bacterium]|nr:MOSC domain-containing protein [Actinomycetota bacterium]